MEPTLPPLPTAAVPISSAGDAGTPRSGACIAAAVLCFIAALFPLVWLALQLSNLQKKSLLAGFMGLRLPYGAVLLEEAVCAVGLAVLLIVCGVMLCVRARWAVHLTGAVMGIVIVGGLAETIAETVRRLADDSPRGDGTASQIGEIALRAAAVIVWPLTVAVLLSSRSVMTAIIARRGSMPAIGVVEFVTGVVLVWFGLAATSLHEQAVPADIYFARVFSGTAVTLWRVAFAAAWALAGLMMLRGIKGGGAIAILVTVAAIASEVMLAVAGGSDVLAERTIVDPLERFTLRMAMPYEPDAPWLAAIWRGAWPLCLLLFLVAPSILLVDESEETLPQAPDGPT